MQETRVTPEPEAQIRQDRMADKAALLLAMSKTSCPGCQRSTALRVASTVGMTRHVKCRSCGTTFKLIAPRTEPASDPGSQPLGVDAGTGPQQKRK